MNDDMIQAISCEMKEAWRTLNDANQFIRDHNRKSFGALRAYWCGYCGHYHVTNVAKRKKNRKKT